VKPVLLSTYDQIGGAARAAFRLHRGLRRIGLESTLLVQRKVSDDAAVRGPEGKPAKFLAAARPFLDNLPLMRYPDRREGVFTPAILPDGIARRVAAERPDVVHLHWVAAGFLRPESLAAFERPVVWTLHDSWVFTGGCHVPGACVRYRDACGACPALGSQRERDLSRSVLERKRRAWSRSSFTVVAPSRWLAEAARSSALLRAARIEVIPNGIDLARFKPIDRLQARDILGIAPDRRIVLFGGVGGAADPNKGYPLLLDALGRLAHGADAERVELLVVGASQADRLPVLPTRFVGPLADEESMVLYLSASDVLVLPSLQENQPNMVVEAMGCGVPTVAFRAAGLPDLVEHERTGYLAEPFEAESLAGGIAWVLEDEGRRRGLGEAARRRAERDHELEAAARRYETLYRSLLPGV
jgi:glycosyltransferase involved in cell wall biosynthesis